MLRPSTPTSAALRLAVIELVPDFCSSEIQPGSSRVQGHKSREAFSPEMGNAIRNDLNRVAAAHKAGKRRRVAVVVGNGKVIRKR